MMLTRLRTAGLLALLLVPLGLSAAHADVFTWVDASGKINVSNLAPPEGVRVTNVVHASPPEIAAQVAAARESARAAEVAALAEHVRQLQDEVAQSRMQMPVQAAYQALPPPPAMPYGGGWAPEPAQYSYDTPQLAEGGCDPSWSSCGAWWGSGFYPAAVIVARPQRYRRSYLQPPHGGHHMSMAPVHALALPSRAPQRR